jgi:hypothetical protein
MLAANTVLKELDVSSNNWEVKDSASKRRKESKGDGPGFAKELAVGISNNGALTSLDISNQVDKYGNGGIGAEGAKYLAEALKDHA